MRPYTFTRRVIVWNDKAKAHVPVDIEVAIVELRLAEHLARHALRNKTRTSGMLAGAIRGKLKEGEAK